MPFLAYKMLLIYTFSKLPTVFPSIVSALIYFPPIGGLFRNYFPPLNSFLP